LFKIFKLSKSKKRTPLETLFESAASSLNIGVENGENEMLVDDTCIYFF
jgi:hypothetical protein